jgi:uncharacterized membrane protein YdcZ (DUF606 family)
VAAATVTGQLITSVILDRIGFLGLEQETITPSRVRASFCSGLALI